MNTGKRDWRVWRGLVAVAVVWGLWACGSMEDKRDGFMAQGQASYEKGDFVAARLHFKNALQFDDKLARGYLWLGKTELRLQNPRAAFGALAKAVELAPELFEAQLTLGNLLLMAEKPEEAEVKANLVLAKEPQNTEALGADGPGGPGPGAAGQGAGASGSGAEARAPQGGRLPDAGGH